jgi:hypothetical protein
MTKKKKDKLNEVRGELETGDILEPMDITKLGSGNDPCFGKHYDLSTKECKMCGDSELCCIKFTALMGKTRKELEAETQFKDLEPLIDMEGCKKYYRKLVREKLGKKEILDKLQSKFELSRKEARDLYRKFNSK